jgi:signal transduction histidine kinase
VTGVRLDAALVAMAVVVAALVVGAVLLVASTRAELIRGVEALVTTRSQDLAQLVATGDVPEVLPSSRSTSAQMIDGTGRVITATGDIEGQEPIVATIPSSEGITTLTVPTLDSSEEGEKDGDSDDDEGPYLVAVSGVDSETGRVTVLVAGSLAAAEAATTTLTPLLVGGIPFLALVVGVTTWILAGRTLKPVRLMTEEAGLITVTDLGRRIPLPGTRDEIQLLGKTLNQMLDRLEASISAQRRFVADASHELKSPVTSLLAMAEVASQHPQMIDVERFAADAHAEARRLALLVDDLLTLARSDEGALVFQRSRFDLTDLLAEETRRLWPTGKTVHLEGVTPVIVEADRRRIAQAMRNVIDNAARHAKGNIWIESLVTHDQVDVLIADDGPGISQADRQKVFERFIRLDEARSRDGGGTGLGLAVVQTIINAHGGTVGVTDHPAYPGAVIRIRLPLQDLGD